MKTLAEFLADYIAKQTTFNPNRLREMFDKGVEAYKEHLRNDSPKTVHWAMIERDLIVALERMQCQDSLEGAMHNNQSTIANRQPGHGPQGDETELDAPFLSDLKEVKHPICPINLYFEGDEDKCNTKNCDWDTNTRSCSRACKIIIKHKVCLQPSNYGKALGCSNCESLMDCVNRENRHCEECLLFNLESQGNCEEPGYGTKADNNACGRFKLNTQFKEN